MDILLEEDKEAIGEVKLLLRDFQRQIAEPFAGIGAILEKSFGILADDVKVLAEHGWYVPYSVGFHDLRKLGVKLNSERAEEVNRFMVKQVQKKRKDILKMLKMRFPNRRKVLEAAFKAHKKGDYVLSVPVFLSQSDGICKEITQSNLFGGKWDKGQYVPPTATWLSQYRTESVYRFMLEPLKHKAGFNAHKSQFNPIGVSRHEILHGESVDYGNEIISCKAISLLNFVGEWIYEASKHIESLNKT